MNNRGFTLIEVLIVVALMVIMMAFAAPSMIQWREDANIKGVASDVLSGLRQARSLAISNNQVITATLDPDAHQLSYNGITKELATNVGLETSVDGSDGSWVPDTDAETVFRPNGSCDNFLFIRVNGDDELKISISSTASGLARL
jgi:type II secretion system protein H